MEKTFHITPDLKKSITLFLENHMGYALCLSMAKDEEKKEFSEEEVNRLLNLIGSFPLRDVFSLVERFKYEVVEIKNESDTNQGE